MVSTGTILFEKYDDQHEQNRHFIGIMGCVSLNSKIAEYGFVFIKSLMPNLSSAELIPRIGTIWREIANHRSHIISPKDEYSSTPNTYSGNYGLGAFPLHTDLAQWRMPPKFVVLRCMAGSPDVATNLLDGDTIVDRRNKTKLAKALVEPRRPIDGSIPLLRLYQQMSSNRGLLRWDPLYIRPASRNGEIACDLISQLLAKSKAISVYLKDPGDTLIFDNWRILHGRSPVAERHMTRKIERAYLESIK